jgi:pimeloyl-ACP methyl ester carboxylesterase
VSLYYEDSGGVGDPVLFHTGGGGDSRMWHLAGYTDHLGSYRHLLLDHRGHGRSDHPTDRDAHRVDEYVSDVIAVLNDAGVERSVLVGYSAGADVAYRLAAAHPERCSALVGIGSIPEPEGSNAPTDNPVAAHLRQVGMRALMEEFAKAESEPAPAWLIDNLATTETEMFALMLEAWAATPGAWELLPTVAAPTLLVVGGEEQDDGAAERAAAQLPNARAAVLPGYGHLQTFWHAEVTGPRIAEFLRSAPRFAASTARLST